MEERCGYECLPEHFLYSASRVSTHRADCICITHLVVSALFRDPRELGLECAEELCGRGLQPGLGTVRDRTAEQSYRRDVLVVAGCVHELL